MRGGGKGVRGCHCSKGSGDPFKKKFYKKGKIQTKGTEIEPASLDHH